MVQMKVTASVLLAAAAIAPVVANGFEAEDSLVTRDDNELTSYFERDFDLDLEAREFEDDLVEREPFGGKILKKAFRMGRKHGGSVIPPQTPNETREFAEEVFEREFEEELYGRGGNVRQGNTNHGGGSHSNGHSHKRRGFTEELGGNELFGRDADLELFEREPILFFNHIKKWLKNKKAKKTATEEAALETRSSDEMEILEREYYDELD